MNEKVSHKHSVSQALKPFDAQIAKIEQQKDAIIFEQERVAEILSQEASLKDALVAAKRNYNQILDRASAMWSWTPERLFEQFATLPMDVETLAERLSQIDTATRYRQRLEKFLHKRFVEKAERELAAFERANKADLKGRKLSPLPEPRIPSQGLPEDFYSSGKAGELTKKSIRFRGADGKVEKAA